ncbi:unnamed protein product [Clavelina lepadiformis]|uniref:SEFIR domain-containing protein n=1 Tax=Clavelina lepadiformis TaxID=159417 RepID=A0ABP0H320_CLALP
MQNLEKCVVRFSYPASGKFLHFALKKPPLVSNKPHKPNLYAGPLQQGQNKTKKTRILLVFNPDHPKHEEVVVTFAQYLQGDLGFDVVFMPWESTIAIEKLSDWISNSIKCDKVIAVWSPAAKIAWYQRNTSMDETPSVFTTIIRHIQEDVVYKKHHGKYFFAYFDYCTDEVLPTDISITRFNLMKDFKELYFRLVDEEQYIPGKRCNYENVSFDAYANQKFGSALNATIAAMHSIAKIDSNWYKNNESKKHYKNCIFTTPQSLHTHSRIPQGPWKNIIPIVHPGNVPINADNKEHRNGSDHEAHCNHGNTQSVTTYNSAKSSFYLSMSTIGEETPSDTTPLHHRNDTESTMPYEKNIISAFRQNLVPCSPIKLAPVSNEGNPVKKLKEINIGNSYKVGNIQQNKQKNINLQEQTWKFRKRYMHIKYLPIICAVCMFTYKTTSATTQTKIQVEVNRTFCRDKKVLLFYNVPQEYGDTATLLIVKGKSIQFKPEEELWSENNWPSKGQKIFEVEDLTVTYTFVLWGSEKYYKRKRQTFDCKVQNISKYQLNLSTEYIDQNEHHRIYIILAICTSLVFIVICLGYSISRQNLVNKTHCSEADVENRIQTKLYIISTDEHEKHMEILNIFASYLQEDLGFIVKIHLWEQLETYEAREQWMFKRMKEADKILVIWSPGAKDLWEKCNANNFSRNYDMFTPVVKQIEKDLFCHKNAQKYYFAHFNYCSKSDIPLELLELVSCTYSLMDDAEKLYFMLSNQENYVPGRKLHNEKTSFDFYSTTTKCEKRLKDSLATMNSMCNKNKDWYKSVLKSL